MGIRVLSGVRYLEVLAYLLRCAMKIPVQSRHALIFRGVTARGSNWVPSRGAKEHSFSEKILFYSVSLPGLI
ncbi:hypothetical protein Hdeb2414_s0012g00392751 [Helianthus debilis subsp. tardiflorus]